METSKRRSINFCVNQIYPIKCQCCPHIEISQLICTANQLNGFYMSATLAFNGLKEGHVQRSIQIPEMDVFAKIAALRKIP